MSGLREQIEALRDERWPSWITDGDDLLRRAINQHSDMSCGCGMGDPDLCYVGWLLEALEPGSVADPLPAAQINGEA